MPKYLILAEKPDAGKDFATALGGQRGHFDGYDYQIVSSIGHVLGLADPQYQVDNTKTSQLLAQWGNLEGLPWPVHDFKWVKKPLSTAHQKVLTAIRRASKGCDGIIIATDTDISGEGDVLGIEIAEALHWGKKLLRCRFASQEPKDLQRSLKQSALEDITVTSNDKMYRKGLARERFDYLTMQQSRRATVLAEQASYDSLIRPGRLKSVIVDRTYSLIRGREQFKPQDQFQAIFVDGQKNKFVNKKSTKYLVRDKAEVELSQLRQSTVTTKDPKRCHTAPPKMLLFSQVGIAVHKLGFPLQLIIDTYQKMYLAHYLSYPRTEDKAVATEQWDDLLPLVDTIADVIGVDKKLLVHREARKPYVVDKHLAHGANRPGSVVPHDLAEIEDKYGKCGREIYKCVAKSWLATMAPDYEYDQIGAYVTDFPQYTASKSMPKVMGYKTILGSLEDSKADDDTKSVGFGTQANPMIDVSQTKPPMKPTQTSMLRYLAKENIGTEATRSQTLAEMLNPKIKANPIKDKGKDELGLTPDGYLTAAVMHGALLASPQVTKQLSQMMDYIKDGKWDFSRLYQTANTILDSDGKLIRRNLDGIAHDTYLNDKLPKKARNSNTKVEGVFLPTGEKVRFTKYYKDHVFTADEIQKLLAGEKIVIKFTNKYKKKTSALGALLKQSFENKSGDTVVFWGFKPLKYGK